jgi:hypothetical protein
MLVTLIIVWDELIVVEFMTGETFIAVCDSLALELLEELAMD